MEVRSLRCQDKVNIRKSLSVSQNIKLHSNHTNVVPSFYYDASHITSDPFPVFWFRLPEDENISSVQNILYQDFPDQPLKATYVRDVLHDYYEAERVNAGRLILSSALALFLATIGAYGLVAQNASDRAHVNWPYVAFLVLRKPQWPGYYLAHY